ncbi:MAG TPA: response regulator [Chloroflexota bacterium]|nr:response regulator [Chloroflexota bacterium]
MKKILLADDEPAVRRLVTATLADETRYQILEASDGAEALRLARAERPAMMLLDVNMPEIDGFEVCRVLKSDPETHEIVVVMLTAMAQTADRERGAAVGADGFFTKPFSPLALLEKVEEVLGG